MKKILKGIVLLPMWPLIWMQMGVKLDKNCWTSSCQVCGGGDGCCARAHRMVEWFRR